MTCVTHNCQAMLTRTELDWLHGNIQVSKAYEYKLKSSIRKKLQIFTEYELPLLVEKGFGEGWDLKLGVKPCPDLTATTNGMESSLKAEIPGSNGLRFAPHRNKSRPGHFLSHNRQIAQIHKKSISESANNSSRW